MELGITHEAEVAGLFVLKNCASVALDALPEDPGSISRMRRFTIVCDSSYRASKSLFLHIINK